MENNKMSVARCRKLLLHFPEQKISFIFFKFEKPFTVAQPTNKRNGRVYKSATAISQGHIC